MVVEADLAPWLMIYGGLSLSLDPPRELRVIVSASARKILVWKLVAGGP